LVRVTYHGTGQSVVVRINDRGPFKAGRIIDLSQAAARAIGLQGIGNVSLTEIEQVAEKVAICLPRMAAECLEQGRR
jgi:rare lipoprotein A